MEKKLVVFDIDGTIISYQGKTHIPPETVETIRRLRENGHILAFATARSLLAAKPLMNQLEIFNAVLHNGAVVIANNESIFEKRMGKQISTTIIHELAKIPLCVFAFDGKSIYVNNATEESKDYIRNETGRNDIIKPLCDCAGNIISINIYGDYKKIYTFLSDIDSIDFDKNQCEIKVKNVSKSHGIKRLSEKLNIAQQNIIAVGDGINDIDMILAAGIGIAVGGARRELKDAADMVADDIDAGGMLKIFEQLKLI